MQKFGLQNVNKFGFVVDHNGYCFGSAVYLLCNHSFMLSMGSVSLLGEKLVDVFFWGLYMVLGFKNLGSHVFVVEHLVLFFVPLALAGP